jgi:hypothetical protein
MTGIGPVAIRQPRVRDRGAAEGERIRYSPSIVPPYARRSKSLGRPCWSRSRRSSPTTKDQVTALLALAAKNGGKVDWVNCGMCVDERGVGEFVADTRRGSPADFHSFCEASDNVLAIPTK